MILRFAAALALWAILIPTGHCQQLVDAPQPADGRSHMVRAAQKAGCCTARQAFHAFMTDSAGPYPIALGLFTAGIHQATDNPPEWHQGFAAFSERFGSNMGITAAGNAIRYGTAWAMNVDPRFKKCECSGFLPRLGHAVKSTAFAHRRGSGEEIPSVPNLAASYGATTIAVYAWYPSRYGAKDAFRMGNYNLLGTLGTNITFEFMPGKVQDFLHRIHLSSARVSTQKP